jgi:hypothetical protein
MQLEKEKAHLAMEILEKFAPVMDDSTDLFNKIAVLIEDFRSFIESFSNLDEISKTKLTHFTELFTAYINSNTANYLNLNEFKEFIGNKTTTLIDEYKIAAGMK